MSPDFLTPPRAATFVLRHARVPAALLDGPPPGQTQPDSGLVGCDLVIDGARIGAVMARGTAPAALPAADLRDGMVWPGFVDVHTHLDKGHIWPRRPNPDGTFMGALTNVIADCEAHWSAEDVAARMDFSLQAAYAHGTVAIRTHLDSKGRQIGISWPVFAEMRERWAGRIELQAVPLFGIDAILDEAHRGAIVDAVLRHGSRVIGAVAYPIPELDAALDLLMRIASEHGFDLDFHVDESSDPSVRALERIAAAAIRNRFQGRILCGHCCTLALQTPDDQARIIDALLAARIAIVSLPLCNMYLQDRVAGRTPRWRGITPVHELRAAGVPVIIASDNTRDPFYAYGDMDMVEVFRAGVRIAQLDHPFADWPRIVGATPAAEMGLDGRGRIAAGLPADLVLFDARNWTEWLSRPQADRVVLRAGAAIARALPDYRALDHLTGMAP
jgi:cytosine deaminase